MRHLAIARAALVVASHGPGARTRATAPLDVLARIIGRNARRHARADLVVRNAEVYTVDAARSWAHALAVANGRLVYVGSESGVGAWIGAGTRVINAGGKLILPGFHDTHVHLASATARMIDCDLGYPSSLEATRRAIAECVRHSAGRRWVVAFNANNSIFPPEGPAPGFLDEFESQRPMVVVNAGGHELYANRAALGAARISASTPDPGPGLIVRDAAGQPTGTLREAAMSLVQSQVPWTSTAELAPRFAEQLAGLARLGIVSIQEMSRVLQLSGDADPALIQQLYAPARVGRPAAPRLRVAQVVSKSDPASDIAGRVARMAATARRLSGRDVNAGTVKIFVDGDLGGQTAALLEPYRVADRPDWRGVTNFTQEQLDDWAARVDRAGLQLHFHAVGDRAVHMALNAIEHAERVNGRRDARHQITHVHLVAPSDLARFRELGVVANVQPQFADNGAYNTMKVPSLIGTERAGMLHRFRDLLATGAMLAVSTDHPVVPIDPMLTIEVALTRREPGSTATAFVPEQRLTLPEVLAAYTIGGAYANFLDDISGSLEVGKSADFVMLDRNLFEMKPDEIHTAHALWTVIAGRDAYGSPRAASGRRR